MGARIDLRPETDLDLKIAVSFYTFYTRHNSVAAVESDDFVPLVPCIARVGTGPCNRRSSEHNIGSELTVVGILRIQRTVRRLCAVSLCSSMRHLYILLGTKKKHEQLYYKTP